MVLILSGFLKPQLAVERMEDALWKEKKNWTKLLIFGRGHIGENKGDLS